MTRVERWKEIPEFPGYSVSSHGRVVNDDTGRPLIVSENQAGVTMVGPTRSLKQHRRSLALLVAQAFLETDNVPEAFDTPIHLDGDRWNNHVDNLMWRPRAFAIKYNNQFDRPPLIKVPIFEEETREEFPTSREAVIKYGLLEKDLCLSIMNRTYVWPTYQIFHIL